MTWTSYFHQPQSQWQVAKLQNLPENPVKAKQVVKAFFISRGTRGNKWRLLLSSIPNSPLLSGWNRTWKKNVCISHIYAWHHTSGFFYYPLAHFFRLPLHFSSPTRKCYHLNVINCVHIKSAHNVTWLSSFRSMYLQSPWTSLLETLDFASKPISRVPEARRFYLTCMMLVFRGIDGWFESKCAISITPSHI